MTRGLWKIAVLVLALMFAGALYAQEAAEAEAAGEAGAAEEVPDAFEQNLAEALEDGPSTFRYDPQGRRDPFQSLIGPRQTSRSSDRPPGVPGFLIEEIDLQGIVVVWDGIVGLIKGPDNKGYSVRPGDQLYDGEIISISPGSIVFRQEVNDPTRIERHREVVMELRRESEQGR